MAQPRFGKQQMEANMAEVVVIGAGLSGTLMAYELCRN